MNLWNASYATNEPTPFASLASKRETYSPTHYLFNTIFLIVTMTMYQEPTTTTTMKTSTIILGPGLEYRGSTKALTLTLTDTSDLTGMAKAIESTTTVVGVNTLVLALSVSETTSTDDLMTLCRAIAEKFPNLKELGIQTGKYNLTSPRTAGLFPVQALTTLLSQFKTLETLRLRYVKLVHLHNNNSGSSNGDSVSDVLARGLQDHATCLQKFCLQHCTAPAADSLDSVEAILEALTTVSTLQELSLQFKSKGTTMSLSNSILPRVMANCSNLKKLCVQGLALTPDHFHVNEDARKAAAVVSNNNLEDLTLSVELNQENAETMGTVVANLLLTQGMTNLQSLYLHPQVRLLKDNLHPPVKNTGGEKIRLLQVFQDGVALSLNDSQSAITRLEINFEDSSISMRDVAKLSPRAYQHVFDTNNGTLVDLRLPFGQEIGDSYIDLGIQLNRTGIRKRLFNRSDERYELDAKFVCQALAELQKGSSRRSQMRTTTMLFSILRDMPAFVAA